MIERSDIPLRILDSTDSTNAWLRREYPSPVSPQAVMALAQSAGRGQRGNVWLSDPGENILLSLLWIPAHIHAREIFSISEATALAVCDTLRRVDIDARIKWPNDIYAGDKKICGILIENALSADGVASSIIGIGLNVNQRIFDPSLPNPVSMSQLTGHGHDIEAVAHTLLTHLKARLSQAETRHGRQAHHNEYMERMWRNDRKPHPFTDTATSERFLAVITDVTPDGFLLLHRPDRFELQRFAFKEVSFVLA